jgi:hypothetical protein
LVLAYKSTTKTITDYPEPGQSRPHKAIWKGANFDRLLSRHVAFARAANAIDETRKDFDRVGWGGGEQGAPHFPGHARLVQRWFAGNHSDIGGSYPEPESRLSDIALRWMCEQATSVPDGLRTGPIYVDGAKMPNTGDAGPAVNIFPAADGVQHCEVAGMRDTLDAYAAKLPNGRARRPHRRGACRPCLGDAVRHHRRVPARGSPQARRFQASLPPGKRLTSAREAACSIAVSGPLRRLREVLDQWVRLAP